MSEEYYKPVVEIDTLLDELLAFFPDKANDPIKSTIQVSLENMDVFRAAISGGYEKSEEEIQAHALFKSICQSVAALPDEFKVLVAGSLSLVPGAGPGRIESWSRQGGPMIFAIPNIAKALKVGTAYILNENEQDAEFRRFHQKVIHLADAASKAESGTRWTRVDIPRQPVEEYNQEAREAVQAVREQFPRVADRFVKMMNLRLKSYKPLQFAEDMAPVEVHDDPERMAEIKAGNRALNKKFRDEAKPYQTGERTVADIVEMLDTDDFEVLAELSCMLSLSTGLYFDSDGTIMTLDIDEQSGEITGLSFPESQEPTKQ